VEQLELLEDFEMVNVLSQSLSGALWRPDQTPWGIGATALATGLPAAINPQGSSRSNAIKAIGGTLLAGLLGQFAQSQADERNAGLYGAMQEFQTATPERREQIVAETPRFSNIAMALAGQQNQIDQDLAKYRAMTPLELDRLSQAEKIKADNDIRVWGARAEAMGGGMGRQSGMMGYAQDMLGQLPTAKTEAPSDGGTVGDQYKPESYESFVRRAKIEAMADGTPGGVAATTAEARAKTIYGNIADLRKKVSDEAASSREAVRNLEQMEGALPKIKDGPISGSLLGAKRSLVNIGAAPYLKEELEARATYQSAASRLTREVVKGMYPITDRDLVFAQQSVGMLDGVQTKEEAAAVVASLKPIRENVQQYTREKLRWIEKHQTDQNFDRAYDAYQEDEPLYNEQGKVRSRIPFSTWFNKQKKLEASQAYAPAKIAETQMTREQIMAEIERRGGLSAMRGGVR